MGKNLKKHHEFDAIEDIGSVLIEYGFADILVKLKLIPKMSFFDSVSYWVETYIPLELRIKHAFEDLGGIYAFFGKWLGERQDCFSPRVIKALQTIQTQPLPEFTKPQLQELLKKEFPQKKITIQSWTNDPHIISLHVKIGKKTFNAKLIPPYYSEKFKKEIHTLHHFAKIVDQHYPHISHIPLTHLVYEFGVYIEDISKPIHYIQSQSTKKDTIFTSKHAILYSCHPHYSFLNGLKHKYLVDSHLQYISLTEDDVAIAHNLLLATKEKDVHLATQAFHDITQFKFVSDLSFLDIQKQIHLTRNMSWVFETAQKLKLPLQPWARVFCNTQLNINFIIDECQIKHATIHQTMKQHKNPHSSDSQAIQEIKKELETFASNILYGIFIATFTIIASLFILFGSEETLIGSLIIFIIGLVLATIVIKHTFEKKHSRA